MNINTIVFHHNDMDGYVSAACVYRYIRSVAQNKDQHEITYTMPKFIQCNYNDKDVVIANLACKDLSNTQIFIVDFSISPFAMRSVLNILVRNENCNIVWIDHHVSIIQEYLREENSDLNAKVAGLRISKGLSAAELTYLYLYTGAKQPRYSDNVLHIGEKDYDLNIQQNRDNLIHSYIPGGLKLVGDWDVWRHEETGDPTPKYLNFEFFLNKYDLYDYAAYEKYFGSLDDEILERAINDGRVVSLYNARRYGSLNKFPVTLLDFPDIRAIACNTQDYSSLVFDEESEKYEVGICYHFEGELMRYSFYRLKLNPDRYLNCSRIASNYNGGGHKNAAGCYIDPKVKIMEPTIDTDPGSHIFEELVEGSMSFYSYVDTIYTLLKQDNVKTGDIVIVGDASADARFQEGDDTTEVAYLRTSGPYNDLNKGWTIVAVAGDPLEDSTDPGDPGLMGINY